MVMRIENERNAPRGWFADLPRDEQVERLAEYRLRHESLKNSERRKKEATRRAALKAKKKRGAEGCEVDHGNS